MKRSLRIGMLLLSIVFAVSGLPTLQSSFVDPEVNNAIVLYYAVSFLLVVVGGSTEFFRGAKVAWIAYVIGSLLISLGFIYEGRLYAYPSLWGLPFSWSVPGEGLMRYMGIYIGLHFVLPCVVFVGLTQRRNGRRSQT